METKVYLDYVENGLEECCDKFFYDNSCVAKAAEYSLLNGGKRTRAIFVFLTRDMCGADWKKSLYRACGVEMIHCYSLIHDDLPCMDNDMYRRGQLTNHMVFGEANAVLAGDALLTFAPQIILKNSKNP